MTIARTVLSLLQSRQIPYDLLPHAYCETTRESAESANIPLDRMAKAVVLSDHKGLLMAVLPGDRYVDLADLEERLGRPLKLVDEGRLLPVFTDCERGAIPPLGPAYGMDTIVDDSLVGLPDVYFEAGDHCELVRVHGDRFLALLAEARYAHFAH